MAERPKGELHEAEILSSAEWETEKTMFEKEKYVYTSETDGCCAG